jgi:hypothetical protein
VNEQFQPPGRDQLEVSVFGPGKGECIVLKPADADEWIVIDSHRVLDGGTPRPVAEWYFDKIGVSPANVYGLLLTHWHEDHTAGAGDLLRRYWRPGFTVGLPWIIMREDVEAMLVARSGGQETARTTSDVFDVISFLDSKKSHGMPAVLLSALVHLPPSQAGWSLKVLSPVASQGLAASIAMNKAIKGDEKTRFDENRCAAAMLFDSGVARAVLMSDVPRGQTGWGAILRLGIDLSCDIVKAGHHGSKTALLENAWEVFGKGSGRLRVAVTPYPCSHGSLPRERELRQIARFAQTIHVTAAAEHLLGKFGDADPRDTPFESVAPAGPAEVAGVGQIRYRCRASESIETRVFKPARRLHPR